MSNFSNKFINNPASALGEKTVNSLRGFNARNQDSRIFGAIQNADSRLEARFSLIDNDENGVDLTFSDTNSSNAEIQGYWCPYRSGIQVPGFINLPRNNPKYKFVFTGAMNGCALVAMGDPKDTRTFRLYHKQNPNNKSVDELMKRDAAGMEILSSITYEEYANGGQNGLVFLHYMNSTWFYISQSQNFAGSNLQVATAARSTIMTKPVL